MIYACPVCNGFAIIERSCSRCGQTLEDRGRLGDLYGPYSPYRPIDDIKMTNGYDDARQHVCLHVLVCEACETSLIESVQETS